MPADLSIEIVFAQTGEYEDDPGWLGIQKTIVSRIFITSILKTLAVNLHNKNKMQHKFLFL